MVVFLKNGGGGKKKYAYVWIKNSENKYLMTQRSENRKSYPLKWECVGGAVIKGETSIQGALREVKEEVGLNFSVEECQLISTKIRGMVEGRRVNDIVDIYMITYNGKVNLLDATTDEVAQIKWLDRKEIESLFDEGKMVRVIKDLLYFLEEQVIFE